MPRGYAAIGVTLDGEREIVELWAGSGGEGAKFWMSVLTEPAVTIVSRTTANLPWRVSPGPPPAAGDYAVRRRTLDRTGRTLL